MPARASDRNPLRQRVNLTIRADVIEAAKELGLNASKAAEAGIVDAIRRARENDWRQANKAAIDAHNERIEREGPAIVADWTKPVWKTNGAV